MVLDGDPMYPRADVIPAARYRNETLRILRRSISPRPIVGGEHPKPLSLFGPEVTQLGQDVIERVSPIGRRIVRESSYVPNRR